MDRKLYTDSFERLLREKSDEFRMYPTRKVWHSIYNNIYPGRRWPSTIISMMLIATFSVIGYLNNNNNTFIQIIGENNSINTNITYTAPPQLRMNKIKADLSTLHNNKISVLNTVYKPGNLLDNKSSQKNTYALVQQALTVHKLTALEVNSLSVKSSVITTDENFIKNNNLNAVTSKQDQDIEVDTKNTFAEKNELLEKYTIENSQLSKKWTDKLALQVYASPSIVYGILSSQKNNSVSSGEAEDVNNSQNLSIGLEAGTAMQYSVSDVIKLKAGLQFNYASYDVEAYQNSAALLTSNDMSTNAYTIARSIDYSNSNSMAPITLHNETYQFSLPVGLEFKLLKNNNLQWNAGATIQPTFIAGGNAYMLSSYNHSFIDESSIINRWNLNAGFETFITYKVNGVTWQFGPQFRYQFSSTYGKGYAVDEKLAVFGIKIGVSKVLH